MPTPDRQTREILGAEFPDVPEEYLPRLEPDIKVSPGGQGGEDDRRARALNASGPLQGMERAADAEQKAIGQACNRRTRGAPTFVTRRALKWPRRRWAERPYGSNENHRSRWTLHPAGRGE